jgi:AraC family transcriptional regulator
MNDLRTVPSIAGFPFRHVSYESQAGFYEARYAQAIVEKRALLEGAVMVQCDQGAGDWSDAPTPDLVISVIEGGRGEHDVDLGSGRFRGRFRPGQALLIAPGAGSSLARSGRHSLWGLNLSYAWLRSFAGEGLELPENGDFGKLHAGPLEDELLLALHRCFRQSANPGPARLFTERAMLLLAARLDQLARPRKAKKSPAPGLTEWQLRRATNALEATMREGISLRSLARLTGLSTFHFARAFKRATGVPPHRYQTQLRIERAKEQLVGADAPVGYDDAGYFCKVFARHVGATPLRYRAERRA